MIGNCNVTRLDSASAVAIVGDSSTSQTTVDLLIHTFVSQQGCVAGNLRLAVSTEADPGRFYMREDAAGAFRGIDTVGRCSANASTSCQSAIDASNLTDINEECGLSSPKLTSLPGRNEALLTYRGAGVGRNADCIDRTVVPFSVEAMIAIADADSNQLPTLTLSNSGTPEALGTTRASRPIDAGAFRNLGYVTAFVTATDSLSLHYQGRAAVTTAPAAVALGELDLAPLVDVDDVGVAAGRSDPIRGEFTYGITFRSANTLDAEQCGKSARIHFTLARLALSTEATPTTGTTFTTVVELTTAAGEYGRPDIAYVPQMVTPNFSRNGLTAGQNLGGYIITYRDPAGFVRVRRIADFDGLPLDDDCGSRSCDPEDIRIDSAGGFADLVIGDEGEVVAWVSEGSDGASRTVLTCSE